jgi:hypothetical protein
MMPHHFRYSNLRHLLEYLDAHSYTPKAHYNLKIMSNTGVHPEHSYSIGPVEPSIFEMTVQGSSAVRDLSDRQGIRILQIAWSNNDSSIILDCSERSLFIKTASLSFTEICRHKLTEQGVSKIVVDLKPR